MSPAYQVAASWAPCDSCQVMPFAPKEIAEKKSQQFDISTLVTRAREDHRTKKRESNRNKMEAKYGELHIPAGFVHLWMLGHLPKPLIELFLSCIFNMVLTSYVSALLFQDTGNWPPVKCTSLKNTLPIHKRQTDSISDQLKNVQMDRMKKDLEPHDCKIAQFDTVLLKPCASLLPFTHANRNKQVGHRLQFLHGQFFLWWCLFYSYTCEDKTLRNTQRGDDWDNKSSHRIREHPPNKTLKLLYPSHKVYDHQWKCIRSKFNPKGKQRILSGKC